MKKLVAIALMLLCTSAVAAEETIYLVPFRPAQFIDAYGSRWTAALIGYNNATHDIDINCDRLSCHPLRAQEAFYFSGPFDSVVEPMVVRLRPTDPGQVIVEEQLTGVDLTGVDNASRSIRLPAPRIDQIAARKLTFLEVMPDRFDMRTNLRVYSPLDNDAEGAVTVTVYREHEGRSSVIFRGSFPLAHVDVEGMRIGYALISWPPTMERTPFPMRVVVESATPVWGFVSTTERSSEPSVSIILPADSK